MEFTYTLKNIKSEVDSEVEDSSMDLPLEFCFPKVRQEVNKENDFSLDLTLPKSQKTPVNTDIRRSLVVPPATILPPYFVPSATHSFGNPIEYYDSSVLNKEKAEVLDSGKRKRDVMEYCEAKLDTEEAIVAFLTYPQIIGLGVVQIGHRGTTISESMFNAIDWATAESATRGLLSVIFSLEVLATHSLTGKPSPAFYGRERPEKQRLDENVVADIQDCVISKVPTAKVRNIRAAITTKCADSSKKLRNVLKKQKVKQESVDDDLK